MRVLNAKFRNKNQVTNVLSFPDIEFHKVRTDCIGEIIISMDVVKEEAKKSKKKEIEHLIHLLIHSMLHLQGFTHKSKQKQIIMEKKEKELMYTLGFSDPYYAN